jgi:Family of unknown function (DUF6459)
MQHAPTLANRTSLSQPWPGSRFVIKPAPEREPPFDDEIGARHLSVVGPLDRPLPFGIVRDRVDACASGPAQTETCRAAGVDSELLPDPRAFGRRLVIAIIELATGRRSPGQLAQHTSAGVHSGLVRDAGRISRLGTQQRPGTVHSVHAAEPAPGVAEVAAVIRVADRFRAIALRLEAREGRWRCVRLQIG